MYVLGIPAKGSSIPEGVTVSETETETCGETGYSKKSID